MIWLCTQTLIIRSTGIARRVLWARHAIIGTDIEIIILLAKTALSYCIENPVACEFTFLNLFFISDFTKVLIFLIIRTHLELNRKLLILIS